MTNVGALSYKLNANVSGFAGGMQLSRSELAMTRRALTDSRTDYEKLTQKMDTLEKAYKAGVLTQEEYTRVQASTRAKSAEGRAAAAAEAEAVRAAADLTRKLMTEEERLANERARVESLKPHLSTEHYLRALSQLDAQMPEVIQHEKARAEAIAQSEAAQRRAEQLVQRLMTTEEKLANERRELEALKPHLSTDQYARALSDLNGRMPEAIAAEKARADAIAKTEQAQRRAEQLAQRLMTTEEKLANERRELDALKPHLTTDQYARALSDLNARMPQAIAAEKARADAIAKTEQAQRRAEQLVQRLMTTEEQLANERRELDSLKPHLTTDQYARALSDLNARMPEAIAAEKARADAIAKTEAAQRRAEQIVQRLMTTEQQLANERRELDSLKPHLTTDQYARALSDLNARMPQAIAAEKARADAIAKTEQAQRRAEQLVQRLMTTEEQLANERRELDSLKPHLTTDQYARALSDLNGRMPEAIAAEKARADAVQRAKEVVQGLMTTEERLAVERRKLEGLKSHITADQYAKALANIDRQMPSVIADQDRLNREIEEGKRITASVENATERYSRKVAELDRLLRSGAITQDTYGRAMKRTKEELVGLQSTSTSAQSALLSQARSLLATYAGLSTITKSIRLAIDAEQAAKSFEVLTGSANNANTLLLQLRSLSDVSPLSFGGVQNAAQTMLAFNVPLKEVIPNMKALADISLGNEERFKSLTLAFAQMTSAGKLMGQDLLQMVNAGFNPLQQISLTTGESMSELRDRMSAGALSATEVTQAFISATEAGGKFHGMTEQLADTMGGRLAISMANLEKSGISLGQAFEPLITSLTEGFDQGNSVIQASVGLVEKMIDGLGFLGAVIIDFGKNIASLGQRGDDRFSTTDAWLDKLEKRDQERNDKLYDEAIQRTMGGRKFDSDKAANAALSRTGTEAESSPADAESTKLTKAEELLKAERARMLELEKGKAFIEQQKLDAMELTEAQRRELAMIRSKTDEIEKQKLAAKESKRIEGLEIDSNAKKELASIQMRIGAIDEQKRKLNELAMIKDDPKLRTDIGVQIEKLTLKSDAMKQEASGVENKALEDAKNDKANTASADRLRESLKTPFDKLVDEIADIQKLAQVGAIDPATARRAEAEARKNFAQTRQNAPPPPIDTVRRGSAELYKLIADRANAQRQQEDAKRMEQFEETKIQTALQERAALALEEMAKKEGV